MQDPLSTIEVVATNVMFFDPAIDMADRDAPPDGAAVPAGAPSIHGEERLETYRRTRRLTDLLFKPETPPTIFVCKPLKKSQVLSMLDGLSLSFRRLSVFCMAVHEIRLPTGQVLKPKKMAPLSKGIPGSPLAADEEWADEIGERFGVETIAEIADVVYDRARLPRDAAGPFGYRVGPGPAA